MKILKQNEDGSLIVVLKVFDQPNRNGVAYSESAFNTVFQEGSAFMRRVKHGVLRGELGTPKAGSSPALIERAQTISNDRVCCAFEDVKIGDIPTYNGGETPSRGIIAKMSPSGAMGALMTEMLADGVPLSFGMRAFVDERAGEPVKVANIITFDIISDEA